MADHPSGRRRSLWLGAPLPPPAGSAGRPCAPSFCRSCWRRCCWCWTFPFSPPGALARHPRAVRLRPRGGHCPVQPPAGGHAPVTVLHRPRRGLVRLVQCGGGRPVLAPRRADCGLSGRRGPLAILASPTFGGTSPELVVVSSDPDIAAVELDYLVKSAIIDTVVYVHVEMAVRSRWRIRAFTSLWRTPIPASFMRRLPPFSASGTMTRTESCSTSLPIPPAGWNTRSSTPI